MGDILDAALEYAQNGFAVLPVRQSDKTPYNLHGVSEASKDPEQIRRWWDMFPTANVAIAMGRASGNIVTVDVDIKPDEGKHGDVELRKWEAQHGDFPNTVIQVTGSGGLHYIFHLDGVEQYKNTMNALPAIDIRGDGAYVVVSPSVYEDGRKYRWYNDISILDDEIAEANQSVVDLLALNRRDTRQRTHTQKRDVIDVAKGSRNQTIFNYASSQVGQGVPFEIALNSAMMLNNGWSDPLDDIEVTKTVKSAYKYEPNEKTIYSDNIEESELIIPSLDDYQEEEVEWLIPTYLPKEQITIICGTGGTGKTSVWASLVASLSTGERTLFDGYGDPIKREPATVMFFSSEDTVENVIKKKIREEGGDMRRIMTLSISDERFEKVKFNSRYLAELIAKYKPALCVFDPIQAFVDGKIKMSDRNAMRQSLRSLIEWGKKYGTAFLIVMHTNKQANVWGRNRMADSADLWDIARCVWMVGDTEQEGVKYLSHEKSNYGRTGKTMLFRNDHGMPTFDGWTDKKDRDFVSEQTRARNDLKDGMAQSECCTAILSELAEHPEGVPVKDIDSVITEVMGYPFRMLKRAKKDLKDNNLIVYFKEGMDGNWIVKRKN